MILRKFQVIEWWTPEETLEIIRYVPFPIANTVISPNNDSLGEMILTNSMNIVRTSNFAHRNTPTLIVVRDEGRPL